MVFTSFIKEPRPGSLLLKPIKSAPRFEFQHPKLKPKHLGSSIISVSDHHGRWMPSSITEEDVRKLRDARYLTGEISHRLPAQGQVIPTPKPGESVVFMSQFLRGLGFPTDPFVRGIMFYYGLEFHNLAPESILHISGALGVGTRGEGRIRLRLKEGSGTLVSL